MYKNCCRKCGSTSLHTEVKGNNTGLYCDDCGAWQRWLGKDELRSFEHLMREATKEEKDSVNKYIESISKPTGVNFYDKEDDIAKIIYDNLNYMYCDNCRCNSEIEKDSYEYGCDDCHRKYNGWGISMQTSKRIAKEILENIGE